MSRRWRPSLAFVLGGALCGTLGLSLIGLIVLRYLGPEIGFRNAALILGLFIAATTGLLGWLLVRLLLRPILGLQAFAAAQETGADPAPLRHFGTRELHRTATQVITMAEALRDREATIRAYTDHVTHELKTPVSSLRAAVELLDDTGADAAETRLLLDQIDGASHEMEIRLKVLRDAARAREARYIGSCHLPDVLPDLAQAFASLAVTAKPGDAVIPMSEQGLLIVLTHLAQNAANHGATAITLDAVQTPDALTLNIRDDGNGISPGNADRIFQPFFTTTKTTGGTGMGLTIIRNILAAHRARIDLLPSVSGAHFTITFSEA